MKKVLVCVQDYPNNDGGVKLMYVHTRNLQYVNNKVDVTVLNFSCSNEYIYEGIKVIPYSYYLSNKDTYDIAIVHAANLRNHYRFLKKHGEDFPRFIFFFHGHEVLSINHDYSKPFAFKRKNFMRNTAQDAYDKYKFWVWRRYYKKNIYKSDYIFVSNWMKEKFFSNLKLSESLFGDRLHITYNNVGLTFEKNRYDDSIEKKYDFITIRANLDDSKYGVDIVNRLALYTPTAKFLVIGKGELFNHIKKAQNLSWINKTLNHADMLSVLNSAKYALMPTRTDAQGLMMCEMAAFGIPVITSNIPVCHEVFDKFENAFFIDNNNYEANLKEYLRKPSKCRKHNRFYLENTIRKELEVIFICR
ncbi:glycosyltransferase family 4 protein [Clostridium sp.]